MFIEGLSDTEKHQLAQYLRERELTSFMEIKHAYAAAQCEQRGLDIHPTDWKNLVRLDEAIDALYGKQRVGPSLTYEEPHRSTDQDLA